MFFDLKPLQKAGFGPSTHGFWTRPLESRRSWTQNPWFLILNPCKMQVLDPKPMGFGKKNPCKMQVLDPKPMGFDREPLQNAGFGPWAVHLEITAP